MGSKSLNETAVCADRKDMELHPTSISREEVEAILDRIRPGLIADGGNVELVAVEGDGTVRLEFQGACVECPAQLTTLRVAIEEPLRRALPGITSVIPI